MDAHPLYNLGFLNLYLHYLIQKPDELESLHLKKKLADEEMSNVKKRFSMLKCDKCQVFFGIVLVNNLTSFVFPALRFE